MQAGAVTSWSASGYGSGSYGYRAQGCNAGGCGPWSNTSVTVVLLPPSTPASINVPASSGGPITITWPASATATTYGLDQSVNGGAWSQVYAGAGTRTTLNAAATGSYSYRVHACNSTGCSGYVVSSAVSVVIVVPMAINGKRPPKTPTAVRRTQVSVWDILNKSSAQIFNRWRSITYSSKISEIWTYSEYPLVAFER